MFDTQSLITTYTVNDLSHFLNKDEVKAINSLVKSSFYCDLFLEEEE